MTDEFDREARFVQKADFLATDLDEDLVVMSLESSSYYGMDPLTRRVFELFDEPRTIAEVCARLVTEYEVELAQCEEDVSAFVRELLDANLVEVATG